MNRIVAIALVLLFLPLAHACIDTGQDRLDFPLFVAGTEPTPVAATGGWEVELTEARLAFGPLYLCANESAGNACGVARAEWLESTEVDLLDPSPARAGEVYALEGEVRSFMYDVGQHWPRVEQQAGPTEAAEGLDDNSIHLIGVARRDGLELPFEARVRAAPVSPGQVTASGEIDTHELARGEQGLLMTFDATRLVRDIDFDQLLDDDGVVPETLPVEVQDDTQAARAVMQGLVGQMRPDAEWGFAP